MNLQHFEKIKNITKYGEIAQQLKVVSNIANISFIMNFIEEELFLIDLDFSENLGVPMNSESQLLHWSQKHITIHSGIMKVNGSKSYHSSMSNTRKHD